jgi:hypothetical protein
MQTALRLTPHIRFGYALPFGTLRPKGAMSYMLGTLYEILGMKNVYCAAVQWEHILLTALVIVDIA